MLPRTQCRVLRATTTTRRARRDFAHERAPIDDGTFLLEEAPIDDDGTYVDTKAAGFMWARERTCPGDEALVVQLLRKA